jgi:hypothetical protein
VRCFGVRSFHFWRNGDHNMAGEGFAFEDCLLKHYVRTVGWLPHCKDRKQKINVGIEASKQRRLRYFTFCAIGAIDVLMLDVAKVIRQSSEKKFDTVVFFDRESDAIRETQKRIPGAIGFPGAFTEIVLAADPDANNADELDSLSAPDDQADELATRQSQLTVAQRRAFIKEFPFDIINLDLEEFAFKPNDPFPGKVINAMRKIFAWQKARLYGWPGKPHKSVALDGFTLMFTTQIGPPNISAEYTEMLNDSLEKNLQNQPDLRTILGDKTGLTDIATLQAEKFADFFKLGLPKVLAGILLENDWYVDPDKGISVYEFARPSADGGYKMLHLVMDVKRQSPPLESRAPNAGIPLAVQEAYDKVTRQIFERSVVEITDEIATRTQLKPTLDQIRARRKKYYSEDD